MKRIALILALIFSQAVCAQQITRPFNGGTGVSQANTKTITLGGPFVTSGAFSTTFTATGTTTVTLPLTGTLSTLAGAEALTNKTLTSPIITGGTYDLAARLGVLPSIAGNTLKILRVNAGETDYELATETGGIPTTITVADTADASAFVALFESATGDLAPKTDGALLYNAATGNLQATTFTGAGSFTTLGATGNATIGDSVSADSHVISGATVINVNSASDGLRINQIGTGNALVVEDSANPDSSPFVITLSGNVITGHTAALDTFTGSTITARTQFVGIGSASASTASAAFSASGGSSPSYIFAKSLGATVGDYTAVGVNDDLGVIRAQGSDGTDFAGSSTILFEVDGTVAADQVPGRITFMTATSAGTLTSALGINSSQNIGIKATGRINLDGVTAAGDTYITESSANVFDLYAGGVNTLRLTATTATVTAALNATANYQNNGKIAISATSPTLASGGCTSPTAVTANGTARFSIGVGTGCAASQPLIFTLPAATTGWNCYAQNSTNAAISIPRQSSAISTTSVTITNYAATTGLAAAWTDADMIVVSCMGG